MKASPQPLSKGRGEWNEERKPHPQPLDPSSSPERGEMKRGEWNEDSSIYFVAKLKKIYKKCVTLQQN